MLELAINFSVYLAGLLNVVGDHGYIIGPAILLLLSTSLIFNKNRTILNYDAKILCLSFVSYFMIQVFMTFFHGDKINFIDNPSRFVLVLPIFLLLLKTPPSFNAIRYGIASGAFFALMMACYGKYYIGFERAFIHDHHIQYSNASMTLGLLSLCFGINAIAHNDNKATTICLIGTIAGISASLISGARGGWIMLPVIFIIIYYNHKHLISRKTKILMTVMSLIFVGIVTLPQVGVMKRIDQAIYDLQTVEERANSSLGFRVNNWKSVWTAFTEKPVLGWGIEGINDAKRQQLERGELDKHVYKIKLNAHNQYLDMMGSQGLVGLFSLLVIFLVPLNIFRKNISYDDKTTTSAVANAGLILTLSVMNYCLTQSSLYHHSGSFMYASMTVILMGYVLSDNKKDKNSYHHNRSFS